MCNLLLSFLIKIFLNVSAVLVFYRYMYPETVTNRTEVMEILWLRQNSSKSIESFYFSTNFLVLLTL